MEITLTKEDEKKMYSNEQKKAFMQVAESLKKYRRAELMDSDNGKDILERLYVDLYRGILY